VASNILLAVAIIVFGSLLVAFGAMAVVARRGRWRGPELPGIFLACDIPRGME
jgi:hypothetical protein